MLWDLVTPNKGFFFSKNLQQIIGFINNSPCVREAWAGGRQQLWTELPLTRQQHPILRLAGSVKESQHLLSNGKDDRRCTSARLQMNRDVDGIRAL